MWSATPAHALTRCLAVGEAPASPGLGFPICRMGCWTHASSAPAWPLAPRGGRMSGLLPCALLAPGEGQGPESGEEPSARLAGCAACRLRDCLLLPAGLRIPRPPPCVSEISFLQMRQRSLASLPEEPQNCFVLAERGQDPPARVALGALTRGLTHCSIDHTDGLGTASSCAAGASASGESCFRGCL